MTKESITPNGQAVKNSRARWIAAGLLASAAVLALRFVLPIYERKWTIDAIEHAGGWVDIDSRRVRPAAGWNRLVPSTFVRALGDVNRVTVARMREGVSYGRPWQLVEARDELAQRGVLQWLARLRSLRELKSLNLAGAALQDADLDVLRDLKDLETLDLSGTRIHGGALKCLERTTGLKSLLLSDCAIDDEGLAHLPRLPELETLTLDSTQITDVGLKHLARLPKLCELSVSNTRVTPKGLDTLRRSNPRIEISDD